MRLTTLYEKQKQILEYIEKEEKRKLDNYNYETRIWSNGYKAAVNTIKNYIWEVLNKGD
ncbi:hypothetical protein [Clostridium sp.]|uniref:hypothetical protein n=1 Tax=Clostridium sp. TaxID=1506 RepID=UPI002FC69F5D